MTAVVLLTAASAWAMAGTIRAADTRRSTRRRLLDIGGLGPPSGDLRPDPVAVLGRVVLRRVLRRPPDAGLDRRAGVAVVGVLLSLRWSDRSSAPSSCSAQRRRRSSSGAVPVPGAAPMP